MPRVSSRNKFRANFAAKSQDALPFTHCEFFYGYLVTTKEEWKGNVSQVIINKDWVRSALSNYPTAPPQSVNLA